MKLIIDISEEDYEFTKGAKTARYFSPEYYVKLILNGTPLDDVKAEIDYERNHYLNLVGDSGYCNGLNKALKIIDNIGKAESEDKNK